MTRFAYPIPKCQAALAPFGSSDVQLDVEVLADRYEVLAALSPLEDEPHEETDDYRRSVKRPSLLTIAEGPGMSRPHILKGAPPDGSAHCASDHAAARAAQNPCLSRAPHVHLHNLRLRTR